MAGLSWKQRENDAALEETIGIVRHSGEPLPPLEDAEAFGALFDRFADAKVVLLGEATHGTSEFYRARAAITRRLVERHGFSIVAAEADWPDAARIDAYVRHRAVPPSDDAAFQRFPAWMWRNEEVEDFVNWLRDFNRDRQDDRRVEFRGLDVYSLEFESWWQLAAIVPALRRGQQGRHPQVRTFSARELTIRTRRPHHVNADGEIVTRTPATFRVLPKALAVYVPRTPPET